MRNEILSKPTKAVSKFIKIFIKQTNIRTTAIDRSFDMDILGWIGLCALISFHSSRTSVTSSQEYHGSYNCKFCSHWNRDEKYEKIWMQIVWSSGKNDEVSLGSWRNWKNKKEGLRPVWLSGNNGKVCKGTYSKFAGLFQCKLCSH